ncbi:MAG: Acg family FMN-binding oxidoreductase [Thermodesulfobacteriota bacterium]
MKMLGGCVLAAGAAPLIPVSAGAARADFCSGLRAVSPVTGLDPALGSILHYASLAPSGHNTQPWYVRVIDDRKIIIGADPERRLPAVDPNNREAMLSLGAFVENLSLAAGDMGYEAHIEVKASNPFEQEILDVTLQKAKPVPYPLERMTLRMTAKHGYRSVDLEKDDVDALADPLGGRLFYFPPGSEHARCIQEGTVEAFRVQTDRDEAQQELVKWLRLSHKAAEKHRDGLTTEGMEIRGLKGWYVRNLTSPEDFMKASMRKRSVEETARLVGQGGGWFVMTSTGESVADLIEVGRGFERMALLARERGVAVHPMTQILEEEIGRREIASSHDAGMLPQFVLRVGYLDKYPDPVSPRRPVSWFLKSHG